SSSAAPANRPRWARGRRHRGMAYSSRVTRIASVKPHPISVPLKKVLWTAHEELRASSVIVVEVRTEDGLTGYGQIHGSPMQAICAWVERVGEIVRGLDALAHAAGWDRRFS